MGKLINRNSIQCSRLLISSLSTSLIKALPWELDIKILSFYITRLTYNQNLCSLTFDSEAIRGIKYSLHIVVNYCVKYEYTPPKTVKGVNIIVHTALVLCILSFITRL